MEVQRRQASPFSVRSEPDVQGMVRDRRFQGRGRVTEMVRVRGGGDARFQHDADGLFPARRAADPLHAAAVGQG